jgi:protein-tyrosine phosphatase
LSKIIDEEALFAFIKAKGISTIIDLRTIDEIRKSPYPKLINRKCNYVIKTLDPHAVDSSIEQKDGEKDGMRTLYHFLVNDNMGVIKRIFETIIESKESVLIHCTAGKDRTGLIAMLLSLLVQENYKNLLKDYLYAGMDTQVSRFNIFYDAIIAQGGIKKYLISAGISNEQIISLQRKIKMKKIIN